MKRLSYYRASASLLLAVVPLAAALARPAIDRNERGIPATAHSSVSGVVLRIQCPRHARSRDGVEFHQLDLRDDAGRVYDVRMSPIQPWVTKNGRNITHCAIRPGDRIAVDGHPFGKIIHAERVYVEAAVRAR